MAQLEKARREAEAAARERRDAMAKAGHQKREVKEAAEALKASARQKQCRLCQWQLCQWCFACGAGI